MQSHSKSLYPHDTTHLRGPALAPCLPVQDKEWLKENPGNKQWEAAVVKARKFGFFLGLENSWLGVPEVDFRK